MLINNYDPYSNQKRTGGPAVNRKKGSLTQESISNADAFASSKGDPYAAYGAAGGAWAKALGPRGMSEGLPSLSQPHQATGVSGGRQAAGLNSGRQDVWMGGGAVGEAPNGTSVIVQTRGGRSGRV